MRKTIKGSLVHEFSDEQKIVISVQHITSSDKKKEKKKKNPDLHKRKHKEEHFLYSFLISQIIHYSYKNDKLTNMYGGKSKHPSLSTWAAFGVK